MFLNSLKVTSIARKIDKHLRDRKFESFKKEPVAICILQCDAKAFKSEFISDLKKAITNNPSLEVDVISYVEELPKDDNGKQALFSDKDIGWNGVLKSDVLKDFSQKRYDILINYYDGERIFFATSFSSLTGLFQGGYFDE